MSIKVDDFKCEQGVNNLAYFKLLQDNLKSQETIIQKVIAKFMNTDSTKELWIERESDDGSWLECPVCHKKKAYPMCNCCPACGHRNTVYDVNREDDWVW